MVAGSHLFSRYRVAAPEEQVQAAMSKGAVLVYAGGAWHGSGANNDVASTRYGLNIDYNLGWLRQEENQVCTPTPTNALSRRSNGPRAQCVLGHTVPSLPARGRRDDAAGNAAAHRLHHLRRRAWVLRQFPAPEGGDRAGQGKALVGSSGLVGGTEGHFC